MFSPGPSCEVTSYSCTQPDPHECCDGKFNDISYLFCLAFCVFCCMECDIGLSCKSKDETVPQLSPAQTPTLDSLLTVVDGGQFGFTVSEYGRFIPIVFGSDKLTGNVFWHSGFTQKTFQRNNEIFYYSTISFALGLCEGEIDAALRMWMGDALIFDRRADVDANGVIQPNPDGIVLGATVDLVSSDSPLKDLSDENRLTKITIFNGSETQIPDGVMAELEGFLETPGYRGLAYVLFENMVVTEAIPSIFVEVLANSNPIFPRLYSNLTSPQTFFDTPSTRQLVYDSGYDQYIIQARDLSGTGVVPNGAGYVVFDGNRGDELHQRELMVTENLSQFLAAGATPQLFIMGNGNWCIVYNGVGLAGSVITYNPFVGQVIDILGPGSGGFNHEFPNAFNNFTFATNLFQYVVKGALVDVLVGVGGELSGGGDVGFALIDDRGQIEMVSAANDILPGGGGGHSVVLIYAKAFIEANPTFQDGATTDGVNIYFFNGTNITGNTGQLTITRATVTGAGSVVDPVYTQLGTLSFNELNGAEYVHRVDHAILDSSDGCILLFIGAASGGASTWLVKWSPFTGTIKWKSPIKMIDVSQQSAPNALLWGNTYSFIGDDQTIYGVDLATGVVTALSTLAEQNLWDYDTTAQQFYNGYDNTISYFANGGPNQVIKVYLDRLDRANVPVADIVDILLRRVGIRDNERDVVDLQPLTLVGYTVDQKKSLKTIFSELAQVFRFDIVESNGQIIYRTRGSASVATITHEDLADIEDDGWLKQHQENDFTRLRKINLTYRDIDREYDNNVQSVFLPKYDRTRFEEDAAIEVSVPVVLGANDAKKLAEILLYSRIVYQSTYETVLAPKHLNLDPGDVITIDLDNSESLVLRLRDISIGNDRQVRISASLEDQDIYNDQVALFGVVGRFEEQSLPPLDPRIDPLFIEMPFRSDAEAGSTAGLYYAYLTFLNRRTNAIPTKQITVRINGEDIIPVDPPIRYPTWGSVIIPPVARNSFFSTDYESQLRIKLVSNTGASLASAASKLDLLNNSQMNLAYVRGELIQFETVVNEGDDVYTLSGLHRGRFGTESHIIGHVPGEEFVLLGDENGVLDELSLVRLSVPTGDSPKKVYQVFMNTNNPFQPNAMKSVTALNLRPWAVSSFKGSYIGDDLEMSWQRRTRYDGQLNDDGPEDVPLNEMSETYDVYLYTDPLLFNFSEASTYLRKVTVASNGYTYTLAEQTADGFDNTVDDVYVLIIQNGSWTGNDASAARTWSVEYKR